MHIYVWFIDRAVTSVGISTWQRECESIQSQEWGRWGLEEGIGIWGCFWCYCSGTLRWSLGGIVIDNVGSCYHCFGMLSSSLLLLGGAIVIVIAWWDYCHHIGQCYHLWVGLLRLLWHCSFWMQLIIAMDELVTPILSEGHTHIHSCYVSCRYSLTMSCSRCFLAGGSIPFLAPPCLLHLLPMPWPLHTTTLPPGSFSGWWHQGWGDNSHTLLVTPSQVRHKCWVS